MFSSNVKVRQTHIEMIMMFKYDDHHMCYDEYTEWMSESVQQQQQREQESKKRDPVLLLLLMLSFSVFTILKI